MGHKEFGPHYLLNPLFSHFTFKLRIFHWLLYFMVERQTDSAHGVRETAKKVPLMARLLKRVEGRGKGRVIKEKSGFIILGQVELLFFGFPNVGR